jgi:hypothetical protein
MTARPASFPTTASNAVYSTGPLTGQPTKIATDAGLQTNGHIPETAPSAQKENYWKNLAETWLRYIDEVACLTKTVTPATLSGNTNNLNPGADFYAGSVELLLGASGAYDLTGIVAPPGPLVRRVRNRLAQPIALRNQNSNSTAANRFAISTGTDYVLSPGAAVWMSYDVTDARWVLQVTGTGGGGTVDFASVSAALATASALVGMNSQGFSGLNMLRFTAGQLALEIADVAGGPVIGQSATGGAGSAGDHLYLRTPSGGRWVIRKNDYSWLFFCDDNGTISCVSNRLQDVGAPVAGTDAANVDYVSSRASNSHGTAIATAAPGSAPSSPSFAREDHVHVISATQFQALLTGGGPYDWPNNIPIRWVYSGTPYNAVALNSSGVFEIGHTLRPMSIRGASIALSPDGVPALTLDTGVAEFSPGTPVRVRSGHLTLTAVANAAAVPAPGAGEFTFFVDASDSNKLKVKDSSGATQVVGTQS